MSVLVFVFVCVCGVMWCVCVRACVRASVCAFVQVFFLIQCFSSSQRFPFKLSLQILFSITENEIAPLESHLADLEQEIAEVVCLFSLVHFIFIF